MLTPGPYYAFSGYGSLSLTVSSPAQSFTEPLSIDEVRNYLKLPIRATPDSAETDTLNGLISTARDMAEILQGRDLIVKQWDLALDYWPVGGVISLRPALAGVDLVQYRDSDGTTHALTGNQDYIVDAAKQPGILAPMYNKLWPSFTPWPSSAILVRFRSGLAADAPFWQQSGPRVKVGMKRLVLELFTNRVPTGAKVEELPFGITSALSYGAVPRAR